MELLQGLPQMIINLETQGLSLLTNAFHFLPSALTVPISGLLLMLLGVVIPIITSKIIMNYNYNSFFSFCALLGSSLLAIALINLTPAVVAYSIMAQYNWHRESHEAREEGL